MDEYNTITAAWKLLKKHLTAPALNWDELHDDFKEFLEDRPGDELADALAEVFIKHIARKRA